MSNSVQPIIAPPQTSNAAKQTPLKADAADKDSSPGRDFARYLATDEKPTGNLPESPEETPVSETEALDDVVNEADANELADKLNTTGESSEETAFVSQNSTAADQATVTARPEGSVPKTQRPNLQSERPKTDLTSDLDKNSQPTSSRRSGTDADMLSLDNLNLDGSLDPINALANQRAALFSSNPNTLGQNPKSLSTGLEKQDLTVVSGTIQQNAQTIVTDNQNPEELRTALPSNGMETRRDALPIPPMTKVEGTEVVFASGAKVEKDLLKKDLLKTEPTLLSGMIGTPVANPSSMVSQVTRGPNAPDLAVVQSQHFWQAEQRTALAGSFSDLTEVEMTSRVEVQSASRSTSAAILSSPDLPRHVSQQLSTALSMSGGKTTEVALNPPELGRVRMSLQTAETGLVISIIAERPETLDLMRRNAMQLAAEFTDIGFDHVELNFGRGTFDQRGADDMPESDLHNKDDNLRSSEETNGAGLQSVPIISTDRVDIRL